MTLSPSDRRAVIELAAEKLVAMVTAEKGGLADMILVPVSVAEAMTGLSSRTLRQKMDFVVISQSKQRVRLSDIRALVEGERSKAS